jgi:hypothetical protein
MKRRKARDMLERRVRSGMEVVDFTGVVLVYSWRGGGA